MIKQDQARIFFSYARLDGDQAEKVFMALQTAGLKVYRDTDEILPAEDWRGRLEGLINKADGVVFLMSPNSVRSEVCSWEVDLALQANKRIVPLIIEDVAKTKTPPGIERLNYIFATPGHDFQAAIDLVYQSCTTDIGWVRAHTTIGERAQEWARAGRPKRIRILRGDELSEAEAWLAAQPDTAPAPTALQRAWIGAGRKAATQRQRNWVIGSLAVAAISIGLGIFAEVNRRVATEQRDRAELILDRGSQTANDLVFDLARRFRDREGVPQDLVRDMLERSRALVDQLALAGENRPDLLRSRAAALTEMSVTLKRQGDFEAALTAAEEARVGFAALAAAEPEVEQWRMDLATGLDRLGDILLKLRRFEDAKVVFAEALLINQALVQARPGEAERNLNLAVAFEKMAAVLIADGEFEQALGSLELALEVREEHDPVGRGTAIVLEKIGKALLAQENIEPAEAAYVHSLTVTESLALADQGNTQLARDLSVIHQKLGELRLAQNDPQGALPHFLADAKIARRLSAGDPSRIEWAEDLIASEDRLGSAYWLTGALQEAEQSFARAYLSARKIGNTKTARAQQRDAASRAAQKLSLARFSLGDAIGALEAAEKSAEDLRRAGDMVSNLGSALNNVAWYALFVGRADRAAEAAVEAIALEPAKLAYALNHAHALMFLGNDAAARELYLRHHGAVVGDTTWAKLVQDDFATMNNHGIETPFMAELLSDLESN